MSVNSIAAGSARAWLLAARPKTLPAAVAPVILGTAVAAVSGGARFLPAFAAMCGALFIQIGTNYANDVADFEKGADTAERLGPTRATQSGMLSARAVHLGTLIAFGFAGICGLYLWAVSGWPIVLIGAASVASGLAYTGGPFPLGYHGLGDVFVFVFFGFVAVCGTAFVQVHTVPLLAILTAIPAGALSTAVLVVNNLRDEPMDRVVGKRTLAVRFGRRGALLEYWTLMVICYVAIIAAAVRCGSLWPLLALVTIPEAVRLSRFIARERGAPLNTALAGTARLLLVVSFSLALGIVLTRM